jgi:acyl-CoA dehydrogenase
MIAVDLGRLNDIAAEQLSRSGIDHGAVVRAIRDHIDYSDRTGEIPESFWSRVAVRGLNTMLVPARFGGDQEPLPAVGRLAVLEDIGFADAGYAIALPGPGLATPPITSLGSESQQQRFFAGFLTDRPVWGAFAITEPDVGSDATSIQTRAVPTDRGYLINGTKCFITNGERAGSIVVFATLDSRRGRFGIRAFVVDRGTPGFTVVRREKMLGLRASQLVVLSFSDCEVPKESMLIGPAGARIVDAFASAQGAWDFMRPMLTAIIVGACRAIREALHEHVEGYGLPSRRGVGREAVTELFRNMDRQVQIARLLAYKAAWRYDNGLPMSKDASMAKAFASQTAIRMAEQALELVGSDIVFGQPRLERLYRDAKAFDILEGTGDMQRLMITAMHRGRTAERSARTLAA